MGKKKRRKAAAGKNGKPVAAQPAALPERSSTNPPGQRYYDMPYSAATPRLINPDLGLHHLVARVGHNAAYEISVTLLDAPDHRLTDLVCCSPTGCWTDAASGTSLRPSGSRCCPKTVSS